MAQTGRSALVGRYAELAFNPAGGGVVLVALCFDWSVEVNQKIVELTAHGDNWEYNVPTVAGWTFRAKGYVVPGSASHYINQIWAANALPGSSGLVAVTGYSGGSGATGTNFAAPGTLIFAGSGVPKKGSLSMPMEMATQEFEIQGHGAPSTGV